VLWLTFMASLSRCNILIEVQNSLHIRAPFDSICSAQRSNRMSSHLICMSSNERSKPMKTLWAKLLHELDCRMEWGWLARLHFSHADMCELDRMPYLTTSFYSGIGWGVGVSEVAVSSRYDWQNWSKDMCVVKWMHTSMAILIPLGNSLTNSIDANYVDGISMPKNIPANAATVRSSSPRQHTSHSNFMFGQKDITSHVAWVMSSGMGNDGISCKQLQ